jgi:hypothetical protein
VLVVSASGLCCGLMLRKARGVLREARVVFGKARGVLREARVVLGKARGVLGKGRGVFIVRVIVARVLSVSFLVSLGCVIVCYNSGCTHGVWFPFFPSSRKLLYSILFCHFANLNLISPSHL